LPANRSCLGTERYRNVGHYLLLKRFPCLRATAG
jgi:hypothetical protein